jgi:hypothetical protein
LEAAVANVTLALDDGLLTKSREYAARSGTSLNALIKDLLSDAVEPQQSTWFDDFCNIADKAHGNSNGWKFNREETHLR